MLIGHMQHNARDPFRDHSHGRIYRVTYPSRPLVKPAKVDGASIAGLLGNLALPEYRTRYRTRRELRERDPVEVTNAAIKWASTQSNERLKLEALWVTWGADRVDENLLAELLASQDHKIRSAAVRVARYNEHKLKNLVQILSSAANDDHGRVRLEAITAVTYLPVDQGVAVLSIAKAKEVDSYMKQSLEFADAIFAGEAVKEEKEKVVVAPKHLSKGDAKLFVKGGAIYARDGYCMTCHQANGEGLPDAGFPPLSGTKWALEDHDRLIKLSLKGLMGPIEVKGKKYLGQVPMTAFGGLLNDEEMASVLTYVRNSFGNKASAIEADQVKKVRAEMKDKADMLSPDELLKLHPHSKK
jgi:mono/diheme cytochrome c family protein